MREVIPHLNYVHVLVVTVAGFLLGWLWYSPVLFVKPWLKEMKYTEEQMKAAAKDGMAKFMAAAFLYTLLSTFGLAALLAAHGAPNWKHGAAMGAFIGLLGPGMRFLNSGVWERRSCRLLAINVGHEVALYTLQGAIIGAWH
ncbi:MAG TPA: DUF1761 domain-containing protein [Opitutaceae bacterium]|nr:DUF1761 domain-containing protein [Opitutaceae bacterium]